MVAAKVGTKFANRKAGGAPIFEGPLEKGALSQSSIELIEDLLEGLETTDGKARFVMDRSGKILVTSPRTRDALACVDAIAIRGDFLAPIGPAVRRELDRMLNLQGRSVATMMRTCGRSQGHCILRGVLVVEDRILVTIHCAHPEGEPEIADLGLAFGLTPSESLVVKLLFSGKCPAEIAKKLDVSVNTVRAHVRHCYEKIGVSSREELWRLVSPYRLN